MTLQELIIELQHISETHPYADRFTVTIPVKETEATYGGTPNAEIDSVSLGFDWNSGKIFLVPKDKLRLF